MKTFVARVLGAGAGFALNIVLARALGASDYGLYVAVWTWVVVLGGVAPLGFSMSATRFIASYAALEEPGNARGFLHLSAAFVIGVAVVLAGMLAAGIALTAPGLGIGALAAAACLPLFAMTELGKGVARGGGWQLLAYGPGYVVRPVILCVAATTIWALALPFDAAAALWLTLAAAASAAGWQWWLIKRRLAPFTGGVAAVRRTREWFGASAPLALVESYTLIFSFADIIVLQFLTPVETVGLYYVAAKVAALVAFVHVAVASAAGKPMAAAHARGDTGDVRRMAKRAARHAFYPTLALAAVLVVFGRPVLGLFGPEYQAGWPLLMILVAGLVAQAAMGPLRFIMSMTGQGGAVARILLASMVANIGLNIVLIAAFGAIGAAVATALVTALSCVLMMLSVRKRLGFWSFAWR